MGSHPLHWAIMAGHAVMKVFAAFAGAALIAPLAIGGIWIRARATRTAPKLTTFSPNAQASPPAVNHCEVARDPAA